MSTIANLDVNIRVNAGHLVTRINTVALKFTWLGRIVDKSLGKIAARFGTLGAMFGNAILGLPNEVFFAVEGMKTAFMGLWPALKGTGNMIASVFTGNVLQGLRGFKDMVKGIGTMLKGLLQTTIELSVLWFRMGIGQFEKIAHEARTAQNLGVKPAFIAALQYKSKLEPVEIEQLLREFERNVTGMTNKNSVVKKAFGEMKLDADDLMKSGTEEAIKQMADAFVGLGSDIERAGVNMELFGRRGVRMQQILAGGRKGIEDAMAEAKAIGFALEGDEAREVLLADNALKEMKYGLEGLSRTAAITIAPIVRGFSDMFTQALIKLNQFKPKIVEFGRLLEFVWKNFSMAAKIAWMQIKEFAVRKIDELLNWMLTKIEEALGSLFDMIGFSMRGGGKETPVTDALREMQEELAKAQKEYDKAWAAFLKTKQWPETPQTFEDKVGRDNHAALRGSLEAYKVIIGANNKAQKARYVMIEWLKKIHERMGAGGRKGARVGRAKV